ncbi:MAG: peptide chain release factor N(5)-glutamine methyltransferase, partial [Planctomycetota bacterium]
MPASAEVWSVARLLEWSTPWLKGRGVESPRLDAEILLAHVLGVDRVWLVTHREDEVKSMHLGEFREALKRRGAREPVARITNRASFFRETYALGPGTLVPRPESEFIVEGALERWQQRAEGCVADVGTGSGCLALSFLKGAPGARALLVDLASEALVVAAANAATLGLSGQCQFLKGDLLTSAREDSLDAVLSNPPYISGVELATLEPEVRLFDPVLALDGGPDGFKVHRRLFPQIFRSLKPGEFAEVEVGWDQ